MPAVPVWLIVAVCEACGHVEHITAAHTEQTWELPRHHGEPLIIVGTQAIAPASPLAVVK